MKRRLLAFLCAALLALLAAPGWAASVSGVYSGGSGTAADPWIIATADDLKQMRDDVNSDGPPFFKYADGHYELAADIYLPAGEGWTPIDMFGGTFDGKGHAIVGMKVTTIGMVRNHGLFGMVSGTIQGLTVHGEVSATLTKGGAYPVGGIVGYGMGATIKNCHFVGDITLAGDGTGDIANIQVGGIMGLGGGSAVEDCTASVRITGTDVSLPSTPPSFIGGIVGVAQGGGKVLACVADVKEIAITGERLDLIKKGGVAGNYTPEAGDDNKWYYSGTDITNGIGDDGAGSSNIGAPKGTGTDVLSHWLPMGVVGEQYNATFNDVITATAGTGTTTWEITNGNVPGLAISGQKLSGTPTEAGTFPITVKATNSAGTGTQAIKIKIVEQVTGVGITDYKDKMKVGAKEDFKAIVRPQASADQTVKWSSTAPTVVSVDATSGKVEALTIGSAVVTAWSVASPDARDTVTVNVVADGGASTVVAPVINTLSLAAATVGAPYEQALEADSSVTWRVDDTKGDALPNGLSIDDTTDPSAPKITGTPEAGTAGTYTIVLEAKDTDGNTSSKSFTLTVGAAVTPTDITLDPMGDLMYDGDEKIWTFKANGTQPVTWRITADPSTLTIDEGAGTVSATGPGGWTVTVTATNAGGPFEKTFTLSIRSNETTPEITTPAGPLKDGKVGEAYSVQLVGGGGNLQWDLEPGGGSLPPGLTLGTVGTISGTPTAPGTYRFKVKATNTKGSVTREFTIFIAQPVTGVKIIQSTTPMKVGDTYTFKAEVEPDDATDKSVFWTSQPDSVATVDANGWVTAVAPGTAIITAAANDGSGKSDSFTLTVTASGPSLTISPTLIPATLNKGQQYTLTLTATGGTGTITWSATGLPDGLSLNGDTISGAPTTAGTYTIIVTAKDGDGNTTTQSKEVTVVDPVPAAVPQILAPSTMASGTVDSPYDQTVSATGGGLTFSVTGGALPPGLTLDPQTGRISGTPTTAGTYTFTVKASNAQGEATKEITITIRPKGSGGGGGGGDTPPAAPRGLIGLPPTTQGGNGSIYGVDSTMEWSSDGGKTWTPCAGNEIPNLAPGTYWVRYGAQGTRPAGRIAEVTVPDYQAVTWRVELNVGLGGSAELDPPSVNVPAGTLVRVIATPDEGRVLDRIVLTPEGGDPIDITEDMSFVMPEADVRLDVTFKLKGQGDEVPPEDDGSSGCGGGCDALRGGLFLLPSVVFASRKKER